MITRSTKLPSRHAIDYHAILTEAQAEAVDVISYLRRQLPPKWQESYRASVAHPTNIVRWQLDGFEYLFDYYSELEATGEVAFDQTVENRVVAVFGVSCPAEKARPRRHVGGWISDVCELARDSRDKGHFIAHCIGGAREISVFSQDRKLNRGWSVEGRTYRQMERYCQMRPGTLCFSRPVYRDTSSVPRWLEFGVLKDDETLWVEVFDNAPQ